MIQNFILLILSVKLNNFEHIFFEKFKENFDVSLKLIENKIAEMLTNQSKLKKLNSDLDNINIYINETEKSLEELKSIFK